MWVADEWVKVRGGSTQWVLRVCCYLGLGAGALKPLPTRLHCP